MLKKCLMAVLVLLLAAGLLMGCINTTGAKEAISNANSILQTAGTSPNSEADLQGTVNGQTYSNLAAGFKITYPEQYKILNGNDITTRYADIINQINNSTKDKTKAEFERETYVPASIAVVNNSGTIVATYLVNIIDMKSTVLGDIVEYANQQKELINNQKNGTKATDAVSIKIDGKNAAYMEIETKNQNEIRKQRQYYLYNRNYLLIITFDYMPSEYDGQNEQSAGIITISD